MVGNAQVPQLVQADQQQGANAVFRHRQRPRQQPVELPLQSEIPAADAVTQLAQQASVANGGPVQDRR